MSAEKLAGILLRALPKDLVVTVEALLIDAVERAREPAKQLDKGHRATVEGHFRHALCNEAFATALKDCGLEHSPLSGSRVVIGERGRVRYARIHVNGGPQFNNVSKSKTKRALAQRNKHLPQFIQPDFLQPEVLPSDPDLSVFFVTRCGQRLEDTVVEIVVTNQEMDMKNPVFREPVNLFLHRYDVEQKPYDNAHPKLKPIKRPKADEGEL